MTNATMTDADNAMTTHWPDALEPIPNRAAATNQSTVKDRLTVADLNPEERTRAEVWTRVMGYHRPIHMFNKGKQAEHAERTYFSNAKARSADTDTADTEA